MRANFTQCANIFSNNSKLLDQYGWKGRVKGIEKNPLTQITYEGCRNICGTGNEYYSWDQASSTITTWILPIVGMILQAPFESNAFWETMLALARWIGSPMSSLSYILWNISVTGKCALMVDMSMPYDYDSGNSVDFNEIRDSFYILTSMNQYSMKPLLHLKNEVEGLLRIVLFSKDLQLLTPKVTLNGMRRDLAKKLRLRRRRSVVPVFISTMWFLFSLAISIQNAFGLIGENETAHDLATGLLLAWLPILILCSIVDRNPASEEDVRTQLNDLIDTVCDALQNPGKVNEFIRTIRTSPEAKRMRDLVANISREVPRLRQDFLTAFAGQGRVRWHYGAAHPILSDIENAYVARYGRYWLRNEPEARTQLVLGSSDRGLLWFDFRELWQIAGSVIIVAGSCIGAFTLSYFTPTVGLGCRSMGDLIFAVTSFSLLVLEFLVWRLTADERKAILHRGSQRNAVRQWANEARDNTENFLLNYIPCIVSRFYVFKREKREKKQQEIHNRLSEMFKNSHDYTIRQWTHRLFFIPVEIFNTCWLMYTVLAQTFGAYTNCRCMTSLYGFGGGYLDFTQVSVTHGRFVKFYWGAGTGLSCSILGVGLVYVVIEWCLQSHLNTADDESARKGLQRTRAFRRYTMPFRYPATKLVLFINSIRDIVFREPVSRRQQTLVWTKKSAFDYLTLPTAIPTAIPTTTTTTITTTTTTTTTTTRHPDSVHSDLPSMVASRYNGQDHSRGDAHYHAIPSNNLLPIVEPHNEAYNYSQNQHAGHNSAYSGITMHSTAVSVSDAGDDYQLGMLPFESEIESGRESEIPLERLRLEFPRQLTDRNDDDNNDGDDDAGVGRS